MNIGQKLKVITTGSAESLAFGEKLANYINRGQLIELVGDLGGGKTTIIKGLAKGLKINKTVTSPTFNIYRSYQLPGGGFLKHFDLYRIESSDAIIANELKEALNDANSIVVIEWAKGFSKKIKPDRLIFDLRFINQNQREIRISSVGQKSQAVLNRIKNDFSHQD